MAYDTTTGMLYSVGQRKSDLVTGTNQVDFDFYVNAANPDTGDIALELKFGTSGNDAFVGVCWVVGCEERVEQDARSRARIYVRMLLFTVVIVIVVSHCACSFYYGMI